MTGRALIWVAPLALAACAGPLSTLDPGGHIARDIALLWWVMLAGAGVITAFVLVLLGFAWGAPRRTAQGRWVYGLGLWFPLAVLTALLGVGLWVGERILPRDDGAVTVHAHAFQWGWQFTHDGADGQPVESDGVLHIPAGQPVDILVSSQDVIHSFWVPRLGGKMDAIPGRVNRLRVQTDGAGRFDGLCAEFCGLGHAGMRFVVVAHDDWPPADPDTDPDTGPDTTPETDTNGQEFP
ncbi:cytochrome c oxidase subunit II [Roseinatronobacter alkalisoli]|uniref:Cytochrome B n=1 Tax=Roseinatronobacter alkalisoli TaxID=3028235 RepID=A0ABT5T8A0_9RHOB|nr:cytochrome B [Roseinatronobacter sp. HJB301]MDD7971355.1 cytochrome B [Roseinatronobacter sp. HJB301]